MLLCRCSNHRRRLGGLLLGRRRRLDRLLLRRLRRLGHHRRDDVPRLHRAFGRRRARRLGGLDGRVLRVVEPLGERRERLQLSCRQHAVAVRVRSRKGLAHARLLVAGGDKVHRRVVAAPANVVGQPPSPRRLGVAPLGQEAGPLSARLRRRRRGLIRAAGRGRSRLRRRRLGPLLAAPPHGLRSGNHRPAAHRVGPQVAVRVRVVEHLGQHLGMQPRLLRHLLAAAATAQRDAKV
mmetsp:Transcript_175/g.437  ORF Transcript_175/g.437 Transcript_175/m.437 type:complete len:236 (-) Transcript_175:1213-1920(-)